MGLFSKKKGAESDDANRNALFGNRKTESPAPSHSPAPSTSTGSSGYGSSAPSAGGNPYAPRGGNGGGYGGSGGGYGGGGGYGAAPSAGRGYGTHRSDSTSTFDSNREDLFGGAKQRQQQHQGYGEPPAAGGGYGQPSGYGRNEGYSGQSGGYGGYGQDPNRQLTAEEEEEEDVEAVKQQIRFTKQESVASTRNALRAAAQAEETGRNTLARLGTQGERLYNTEKNLDVAANHNRVAEEKARELKTLNGSMFAVHVKNPFNSASRAEQNEAKILAQHQSERDERERTRGAGYEGRNRVGKALNETTGRVESRAKSSLVERSKYQFEADDSDDELENEIDHNLDQLGAVTGRLKGLAMATSAEVDRQNHQIDKIMKKVRFSPFHSGPKASLAYANLQEIERSRRRPNRRQPQQDPQDPLGRGIPRRDISMRLLV